jgi:uncharacterized damage-inducible protein DinB
MREGDVRFLFAYDRWATERVLAALDGIPDDVWSTGDAVGERGLGSILVHQLGAAQRWRHAIREDGEEPVPEDEPLLSIAELRARWSAEWEAVDTWLRALDDATLAHVHEGVAVWQMLAHVVNHGTQHRSEAAALLTGAGHSPGDLDMIDYVDGLIADGADASPASDLGGPR